MKKVRIGIEIECIYNHHIVDFNKGGYHRGVTIPNLPLWEAQDDGSVSSRMSEDSFEDGSDVELVSDLLKGKSEFDEAIQNIFQYFSRNGRYELKEVLSFNQTCGCHMHLSLNGYRFENSAMVGILFEARNYLRNRIKMSKILPKNVKTKILKHYYRDYAPRINPKNYTNIRGEFNLGSERSGHGLEWRSLNLYGVSKWSEFFEVMKIFYESIEHLCRLSQNYTIETDFKIKPKLKNILPSETEEIIILPQCVI